MKAVELTVVFEDDGGKTYVQTMHDEDWLCVPFEIRACASPTQQRILGIRGGILAVVEVYDCVFAEYLTTGGVANPTGQQIGTIERDLGDYSPGRYGIMTRNLRVLRNPVACKGMQGLWTVPSDIEAKVKEQMP